MSKSLPCTLVDWLQTNMWFQVGRTLLQGVDVGKCFRCFGLSNVCGSLKWLWFFTSRLLDYLVQLVAKGYAFRCEPASNGACACSGPEDCPACCQDFHLFPLEHLISHYRAWWRAGILQGCGVVFSSRASGSSPVSQSKFGWSEL